MDRLAKSVAGRYAVERKLGEGGMATVYLAKDLKHDREVAIKVLRPELAATVGSERFLAEIKITAGLTHPNILPLLDSGTEDGLLYYVTPYIAGQALDERLQAEFQLPITEAVDIARQIASALEYAHRHGVIHRDVKPGNVLLHEGAALLTDFGIALALANAAGNRLTEVGYSPGTPEYMSPEQGAGDSVDHRTDIYSLASVLYEMLTGEPPFSGRTAQTLIAKRLTDPVPSARRLRDTVSESLDAAVMMGLAKNPVDRYDSAGEFAEVLNKEYLLALAPEVLPGRRSTVNRVTAAVSAALMLIAAILLVLLRSPEIENTYEGKPSLAVLPLENLSADADTRYIVDGIHEALVSELGRVLGAEVDVLGRRSVERFRDSELSIPQIARELGGVQLLVEGDVVVVGDRVRVSVRLIDTHPERTRWSESYDFEVHDILSLYGAVAEAIAGEIEVEMDPGEHARIAGAADVDQEAYKSYLRGRRYMNQMTDIELDVESALISFGRALERDSTYAKAYAGTARAYYMLAWSHLVPPELVWPGMQQAVARAIAVDDGSADVRASVALLRAFHDWDWTAADHEFQSALQINPSKVESYSDYSLFLSIVGRHEEAVRQAQYALRLMPEGAFEQWQLGFSLLWSGRVAEALQQAQSLIDTQPGLGLAYFLTSNVRCVQGRFEDAVAAMRDAMRLFREDELADEFGQMGFYFGRLGQADSALAQLGALDRLASRGRYVSPLARAFVYIGLGDHETALRLIEEAYEGRDPWIPYIGVWKTSFFAPIQSEPRFLELLRKMGLPAPGQEQR